MTGAPYLRLMLLALAATLVSCVANQPVIEEPAAALPARVPPDLGELVARHDARIAQLQTIRLRGVIELRFEDKKGKEVYHQGEATIWAGLPDRMALKIAKIGNLLFWIGSDAEQYWLFDFLQDKPALYVAEHAQPFVQDGPIPFALRPRDLVQILGFTPLEGRVLAGPDWSDAHQGWLVTIAHETGTTQLTFDPQTKLPIHVVMLDDADAPFLTASLSQYRAIDLDGTNALNAPHVAQMVDITARSGLDIKLAVRDNRGPVKPSMLERLTDLERLIAHHRPDRVRQVR